MDHNRLLAQFAALNPYEQIGKAHLLERGTPLNFSQFLYIYHNSGGSYTPQQLYTPEALAQQALMRQQFLDRVGGWLSEEVFFEEGRTIELEQLLRYMDFPPHRHDFLECTFVLSGSCNHIVAERSYIQEAGSCAIIVPGIGHRLLPTPDCVCLTVKIKKQTFRKMEIPNLPSFTYPVSFDTGGDPFITHTLLCIYQQQKERLPYSDRIIEQMFQTLMTYILQKYRETMLYLSPQAIRSPRLLEILNYIFENYQTISLTALADHFHYNPSYLSQMIHRETGLSFVSILREFRLRQAAQLLEETGLSLSDICDTVGYKDPSQFIRNFKELYHATPMQYRRSHPRA